MFDKISKIRISFYFLISNVVLEYSTPSLYLSLSLFYEEISYEIKRMPHVVRSA
jgi:hypothetical protein